MHGDETLGRQLLLYMAQYLVQNYQNDPRVRKLVDETEIHLLPTMNPDGFAISREGCGFLNRGLSLFTGGGTGRENANGKDLNRDFPKQFDEPQDVSNRQLEQGRQPETM